MKKKRKIKIRLMITLGLILVLICGLWFFVEYYTVKNVEVNGNLHYTDAEIENMVTEGMLGHNTVFLSLKYKNREVKDIPFVDVMDVTVLDHGSVRVNVYEKALAGYVKCLDTYLYFDKDGYVVEISTVKTEGIPLVTGLDFDYCVIGEPLPVKDPQIFSTILDLTKLMDKYETCADRIYFTSDSDVILYYDELKINLGKDFKYIEEKFMLLPEFVVELSGKKGTLHMENYSETNTDFTFKPDAK
ncbi:MAG: cell division protein FtsQ [Acetatifactor sp.]|nr:cell division protein FtsQ [Acetatifactor sp.]